MLQLEDSLGLASANQSVFHALVAGERISSSLVVDEYGATVDLSGGSKQLGGPTDLLWLKALRSRVNLVVTGGNTYRTEQYRMPKTAALAVFSRSGVKAPAGYEGSPRFLPQIGELASLSDQIKNLNQNFPRLHLEFGPQTLLPVLKELGIGVWVSSQYEVGLDRFREQNSLTAVHRIRVQDLYLAHCR
ncbi:MAG: hypothetical protein RLZ65_699 [Actinomycetota bacterium]